MVIDTSFELANIWVRVMRFEHSGDVSEYGGHSHPYDHAHLLAAGGMDVDVCGEVTHYDAPALIWIKAGLAHKQTATADNTVGACIHALRDGSGLPIDPTLIPKGSTAWDFSAYEAGIPVADALTFAEFLAFKGHMNARKGD